MKTIKANARIYFDFHKNRKRKDGTYAVKICVTFRGQRKYYRTGISLTEDDYNFIFDRPKYKKSVREQMKDEKKQKTQADKDIEDTIVGHKQKAVDVIKKVSPFTYTSFETLYFTNRNIYDSIYFEFDEYIKQLRLEERIGTADSYQCARNSLYQFNPNLSFADINKNLLKKYERSMLSKGKSKTTIGIYVRSLRTIYNLQGLDASLYPFGNKNNQYKIPTSKNIKKALKMPEINAIYNHEIEEGTTKEMARDYWMFLYLCNGMNIKDFCLLRWKNISKSEKILSFVREKTKNTTNEETEITISLKPEAWDVINRWGQKSLNENAFIFPHLTDEMTLEKQKAVTKQLTKTVNKYMKQVGQDLQLSINPTTYSARHSFASALKGSANITLISSLMGHSSIKVTQRYLDSFEDETITAETEILRPTKTA